MIRIEQGPRFQRSVGRLSAAERSRVEEALLALQEGFGQPHLHAGLSLRQLRPGLFECRAGLRRRLLFTVERGTATVYDVMTHDELRAFLRSF